MANVSPADSGLSSTVLSSLRGKHVLLTGTTGFLGKVILEKLLRSVPDIGGIHLLIRGNRRHPDAEQRFLHEIASSSVFDRLRQDDNEAFDALVERKVQCVTGEVTEPDFGMEREAFEILAGSVDAVINSAASVNFREELDKALAINTLSLDNLAAMAEINQELSVIQVSTCYVNGINAGQVAETASKPRGSDIPRSDYGYYETEELIRLLQDKVAEVRASYFGEQLESRLVALGIAEANRYGWSDTYTFTKWLGEQKLLKALRGRSLTIVRPSIIESALAEPAPGWIEGVKVADAIILAYAREKVFLFPGKRDAVIDIIPVDMVANAIVLGLGEALTEPGHQRIYQCCSGSSNPITLGELIDHVTAEAQENHASYDQLFYRRPSRPFVAVNRKVFDALMTGARLPLSMAGRALKILGQTRELTSLRNIDTARSLATIFGFYTAPDYIFRNDQLMALADRMGDGDKQLFPVDPQRIDWHRYIRAVHLAGLNRYALKERKMYSLRSSRRRRKAA
jgi:nucleoside-diphosphate-sugar epimerase